MRISILVLGALMLGSCVSPQSTECPGGLVCPVGSLCAAKQEVCIKDSCGNGVVDTGEVCDDGNIIDGDGCSKNCKSAEGCGNGIIDTAKGEVCDDGNTASGDNCSADCKSREGCGNGVTDPDKGEVCDDNNNINGDGCSSDCKSLEVCGNKIQDVNEACDDGNQLNGDGCSGNCKSNEKCGNGTLDLVTGEKCDDGNQLDLDGCRGDCKSDERCGNGVPDPQKGEVCDDGNNISGDNCSADCKSGEMCLNMVIDVGEQCDDGMQTALCNTNCTISFCGDGLTNSAAMEDCDDAGESATCNADCTGLDCGDRHVNALGGEECDDGNSNEHDNCVPSICKRAKCGDGRIQYGVERCDDGNTTGGDTCSADCQQSTLCGNGNMDPGEACDDSNRVSNDNCSFDCLSNETCGNGYVDVIKGEKCDDGNVTLEANGCSANCLINTRCGNGILDSAIGEICDDGNTLSGDGCRGDCVSNETCGNGIIDSARGETCDDGNLVDGDACPNTCRSAFCGDGVTSPPEMCDDTNSSNLDACLNTCVSAFCGDGFKRTDNATEACDDGDMNAGDGCNGSCQVETGFNCVTQATGESLCTAVCGDGMILLGEACDDFNASTCGGCNMTCTGVQAPAAASGTITAIAGDLLRDGETFTISDGVNVRIFEFDRVTDGPANGVSPGRVAVTVNGGGTAGIDVASTVASKIQAAIMGVSGAYDISITGVAGAVVSVANETQGAFGNVAIGETVQNAGFLVVGMSGGRGADCANGTGCRVASDCQSGNCNTTTHVCVAPACNDGIKNGAETGIDCGGSCNACPNGQGCLIALDCDTLFCNNGICQSCAMDGNCLPNQFCDPAVGGGTCTPDKANGGTCTSTSQCSSANCADGFCCDTPCSGSCLACSNAKKGGGGNGVCGNVGAGTDPDNECPGVTNCSGGACVLIANGGACSIPSECTNNFCVDGVCCDNACGSLCQACSATKKGQGSSGTCGNIITGSDPDTECTGSLQCDGSGACQVAQGAACTTGQQCTSGFCVDGVCCNDQCNGSCRACTNAKTGGTTGVCGDVTDGTDPDNECAGTITCGQGGCKLTNGNACTGNGQCDSNRCVDSVCCDTTCTGTCQACNVAGSLGTCSPVPADTDPATECSGALDCNGAGGCEVADGTACTLGTQCGSGNCIDGFCCNSTCTGTCMACNVAGSVGTCSPVPGNTNPADECGGPGGAPDCNGAGVCESADGTVCGGPSQCSSGNCVDGVCCNSGCTGTCMGCNVVGSVGTCTNILPNSPDNFPASTCVAPNACDGAGLCKLLAGQPCALGTECLSGSCADGVCCNNGCGGTCMACNLAGNVGTCSPVAAGISDADTCGSPLVCSSTQTCVQCVSAAQCSAPTPTCNTTTNLCE